MTNATDIAYQPVSKREHELALIEYLESVGHNPGDYGLPSKMLAAFEIMASEAGGCVACCSYTISSSASVANRAHSWADHAGDWIYDANVDDAVLTEIDDNEGLERCAAAEAAEPIGYVPLEPNQRRRWRLLTLKTVPSAAQNGRVEEYCWPVGGW